MNPPTSQHAPNVQPKLVFWGYVLGATLCVVSLLILSIALGQVMRTATRGVHKVSLPGTQSLSLKNEGLYLGIVQQTGEEPLSIPRLSSLQISLSRLGTGIFLPVERMPGAQVAMAGGKPGLVLFQTEVPSAGQYLLNGTYPPGMSGPTQEILLIHENIGHNRRDIAAGVIVFLVIGITGLYVLVRTRKLAVSLEAPPAPVSSKKKPK